MSHEDSSKVSCLYRLAEQGQTIEKHEVISLEGCEKVTMGRDPDRNDIYLDESPVISRQHVCFQKVSEKEWTIIDLNSGNGVYVEGKKLTPSLTTALSDGDVIEIGKDPTGLTSTAYKFKFYEKARLNFVKHNGKRLQTETDSNQPAAKRPRQDMPSLLKQKLAEQERLFRRELEMKEQDAKAELESMALALQQKEDKQSKLLQSMDEVEATKQKLELEMRNQKTLNEQLVESERLRFVDLELAAAKVKEMEAQMQNLEKQKCSETAQMSEEMKNIQEKYRDAVENQRVLSEEMTDKEKLYQERLQKSNAEIDQKQEQLESIVTEKENLKEKMSTEMQEQMDKVRADMDAQQLAFEDKKQEMEEELHKKNLEELAEQGREMQLYFQDELLKLTDEKEKIKQSLESEMLKRLEEKDKHCEETLRKEHQTLSKKIADKEDEQLKLVAKLSKKRKEIKKARQEVLESKSSTEAMQKIGDINEDEFNCCICNELFIEAVSLACTHTFCWLCIEQWKDVKKDCPQCRSPITTCVRSLIIDNYIEKITQLFNDEFKSMRKTGLEARKSAKKLYVDAKKTKNKRTPPAPRREQAQQGANFRQAWADQLRLARQQQLDRYQMNIQAQNNAQHQAQNNAQHRRNNTGGGRGRHANNNRQPPTAAASAPQPRQPIGFWAGGTHAQNVEAARHQHGARHQPAVRHQRGARHQLAARANTAAGGTNRGPPASSTATATVTGLPTTAANTVHLQHGAPGQPTIHVRYQ